MRTKVCTHCTKRKSIKDFSRRAGSPGQRQSWCKACVLNNTKVWGRLNRSHRTAKQRERRAKNPARHNAMALAGYYRDSQKWNQRRAEHRKNKPKVEKSARLKRAYGIDLQEYNSLLRRQRNGCAICRTTKMRGRGQYFHVDHCHVTGRVRGLLCGPCNSAIGFLKDSHALAARAAEYLK